jgi:RNA polymerase sigma-70 factor, ECF subfamily
MRPASASEPLLDEAEFSRLFERHRRELHVHCYRMVGSLQEAEDLVQDTFLLAWRGRTGFRGHASFRTWLYRIATNTCLNALRRHPRRVLPEQLGPAADPELDAALPADLPWLQPYPDAMLDEVVARETIELAFLAAIQHLPPRQRAVFILRDVLDWPASDVAALLDVSLASVNSALQRARATLKERLPEQRRHAPGDERALLERFMDAFDRADTAAFAALLHEDARLAMPPMPGWYAGRAAVTRFFERSPFAAERGAYRLVPTRANRQPAFAAYRREPGESDHAPLAIMVLTIDGDRIAAIDGFVYPQLFPAFGLPSAP